MKEMIKVKATREGLVGHVTSSGYVVDKIVPFVALPCFKALGRFVHVKNVLNNKSCLAIVLDVGPWNINDDAYVIGDPLNGFSQSRPQSESGKDTTGRPTNHAGIDLSEKVWHLLGMIDNTDVSWEFIN